MSLLKIPGRVAVTPGFPLNPGWVGFWALGPCVARHSFREQRVACACLCQRVEGHSAPDIPESPRQKLSHDGGCQQRQWGGGWVGNGGTSV